VPGDGDRDMEPFSYHLFAQDDTKENDDW
jgi:hypothetical protein